MFSSEDDLERMVLKKTNLNEDVASRPIQWISLETIDFDSGRRIEQGIEEGNFGEEGR